MALSMGTNVWSGWKVRCTIPEEVSRAHSLAGSWRMNLIPSKANILWSIYTAYTGLLSFTTTSLGPEFFTSSTACRQGSELSMVLASRWLAGYTGHAWKQGMRTCPSGRAERATRMPNRSHNSHTIPIKLGVLISAQCFVLLNQLSSLPQSILTRWASCCCKNALELDGSFPGFGTKESRKGAELAKSPNSQLQCPLFAFNPDFDITIRNYLHVLRTFHTLSPQPMFSRFLSCSVGIARLWTCKFGEVCMPWAYNYHRFMATWHTCPGLFTPFECHLATGRSCKGNLLLADWPSIWFVFWVQEPRKGVFNFQLKCGERKKILDSCGRFWCLQ